MKHTFTEQDVTLKIHWDLLTMYPVCFIPGTNEQAAVWSDFVHYLSIYESVNLCPTKWPPCCWQ